MFETVIKAVLAHKQIVIAAVALSALGAYMIPGNFFAATAQVPPDTPGGPDFPIIVDRDIEIPCRPYCDPDDEPEDVIVDVDDIVHVRITFSFV
jgi:hypothetical protein